MSKGAKLVRVQINAAYKETHKAEIFRTYGAEVTLTFEIPEDEIPEWKEPAKVSAVRRHLSEVLKKSVHAEMVDDGVLILEGGEGEGGA